MFLRLRATIITAALLPIQINGTLFPSERAMATPSSTTPPYDGTPPYEVPESETDILLPLKSCSEEMWLCEDGQCLSSNETCSGVPECQDGSDETVALCGCLEGEFECHDRCIANMLRCDTFTDCKDGEDERECDTWYCPSTHFKCHNGFCIPSDAVCDFVNDCGDNSDEEECDHRECYFKEFRCSNGECVRPGLVCDGVRDCVDNSDEVKCKEDDFALCASGKAVHRFYWCDKWPECDDNHADEIQCGPCSQSEFLCPNTQCIKEGNVCDAQCDCADCADELNCQHAYTKMSGVAHCSLGVSAPCIVNRHDRSQDRCISAPFLCDGFNHCHNGWQLGDETGCDVETCPGDASNSSKAKWFRCHGDGRCLPGNVRCDMKVDCLHGEDEMDCEHRPCGSSEWRCASGECVPVAGLCNLTFECRDRTDEMNCENHPCPDGFARCGSGQCLLQERWCDHRVDCHDASDEEDCGPFRKCSPEEFPCADGRQCIHTSQRCVFSRERQKGCADNSHLSGCRDMVCPSEMLKCRSGPCLNESLKCDGIIDCPDSWDDEDFCLFQCSVSVPECRCHHLEADCSALQMRLLPDIEPQINRYLFAKNNLSSSLREGLFAGRNNLVYLDISTNGIEYLPERVFEPLWRLRILLLSDNRISHLTNGAFIGLHNLRTLDLKGNNISSIGPLAYYGLSALSTLDLSHQSLKHLSPNAFMGLRNLTTLTLAYNILEEVQHLTFAGLHELQQLNLEHNFLERVNAKVFSSMSKLRHLATDERRWCCLAPTVRECLPPADEFSSCEDLMSSSVLRVCIWVLGTVALFGNSFVIVWRSLFASGNKLHSFLIVNLAFGDLLMGAYLLVIAAVDVHFRGVYAAEESSWRKSVLCRTAGFCSTLSSEISVFTLTVITVDRLMVIRFPFNARRFDGTVTRLVMVVVWVTVIALAALPLAPLDFFAHFYGRSGVCLALHITNEKPNGWQYAVFIFIVLNFLSFAIIAVSYVMMYTTAKSTQTAARDIENVDSGKPEASSSASMARRMTLIVVTDAACWLPIIALGIASLLGVTIPPKIYAWVAVFVLPLNAAVNPILYTLSTAPVRKRIRRLWMPLCSRTGSGNRHDQLRVSVSCSNWKSSIKSRLTVIADSEGATTETRLIAPHISVTALTSFPSNPSFRDSASREIYSEENWAKSSQRIFKKNFPALDVGTEEEEEKDRFRRYAVSTGHKRGSKEKEWSKELVPLEDLTKKKKSGRVGSKGANLGRKKQSHDHRYD